MSSQSNIVIHASIIHRIVKSAQQKSPNVTPPVIRENLHANTNQVKKLIDFLDKQLVANGLAHSYAENFLMSNTLANIFNKYHFSKELDLLSPDKKYQSIPIPSSIIENEQVLQSESSIQTHYRRLTIYLTLGLNYFIYEESMTTGDHLPIIFYEIEGKQYLYMALLSLNDHITIDEDSGEILDTTTIDTSALKVACKISLDELREHFLNINNVNFNPSNYVSWIQRGNEKIAEYIQNFIPVGIRIDDKSATRKIMTVLTDFLKGSDFPLISREEIYHDVLKLLKRKAEHKQNVNITEEIDPIINLKADTIGIDKDIEKNDFKDYRENNGYGTNDKDNANTFSPEKNPLKNFETFDIRIGDDSEFLKISGLQSILGEKIKFNNSDPNEPKIEIILDFDEVDKVERLFDTAKPYES